MLIGRIQISLFVHRWRIVYIFILCFVIHICLSIRLAHFYFDNYLDDGSSGLFGVLDGHGGNEVVDYVTKVLPEVFLKDFGKWSEY